MIYTITLTRRRTPYSYSERLYGKWVGRIYERKPEGGYKLIQIIRRLTRKAVVEEINYGCRDLRLTHALTTFAYVGLDKQSELYYHPDSSKDAAQTT